MSTYRIRFPGVALVLQLAGGKVGVELSAAVGGVTIALQ
jgi:hypothetical protein